MRISATMMALCLTCLSVSPLSAAAPRPTENAKPIRVLLTYGGHGFEEKEFYEMWDGLKSKGITYDKAQLPQSFDLLQPGLEKRYDVLAMYDMLQGSTPQQRERFIELLKAGIGVVSLHHNLCAHDEWPEWRSIVGGRYFHQNETIDGKEYPKSHYLHDQHLQVKIADKDHPITKGLSDFQMEDEAYWDFYVSPKSHVLLTVDHPKCGHDVAWTTHVGSSEVFYLMFGHGPSAWRNPTYQELLARGIHWAARSTVEADKTAARGQASR